MRCNKYSAREHRTNVFSGCDRYLFTVCQGSAHVGRHGSAPTLTRLSPTHTLLKRYAVCLLPMPFAFSYSMPFAFSYSMPFASSLCLLPSPFAFCFLPFAFCLLPFPFAFSLLPFAFSLLPFAFSLSLLPSPLPFAFSLLPFAFSLCLCLLPMPLPSSRSNVQYFKRVLNMVQDSFENGPRQFCLRRFIKVSWTIFQTFFPH